MVCRHWLRQHEHYCRCDNRRDDSVAHFDAVQSPGYSVVLFAVATGRTAHTAAAAVHTVVFAADAVADNAVDGSCAADAYCYTDWMYFADLRMNCTAVGSCQVHYKRDMGTVEI